MEDGVVCSRAGACCDNCRAVAGARCAGGWRREEVMTARFYIARVVEIEEAQLFDSIRFYR